MSRTAWRRAVPGPATSSALSVGRRGVRLAARLGLSWPTMTTSIKSDRAQARVWRVGPWLDGEELTDA